MEDRFKFRCWNKEEKIMHYDAEETYNGIFGKPKIKHTSFSGLLNDKDYVVMQSTGLKDKKDKLIFEGDIIIINHTTPFGAEIVQVFTVEFADGCFWARNKIGAVILYHEDNDYEVIGNVYENKELLEEK